MKDLRYNDGMNTYKHAHIGIKSADPDASVPFWCTVLKGTLVNSYSRDNTELRFIRVGDIVVELIKTDQTTALNGVIDHITFAVDDVEEELKRLETFDVEILNGGIISLPPWKILFFRGPDGVKIEFMQNLA